VTLFKYCDYRVCILFKWPIPKILEQATGEGGYSEVVELLPMAGVDVNTAPGKKGCGTALQAVAEGGHLEV
jgi:hypothetical protein